MKRRKSKSKPSKSSDCSKSSSNKIRIPTSTSKEKGWWTLAIVNGMLLLAGAAVFPSSWMNIPISTNNSLLSMFNSTFLPWYSASLDHTKNFEEWFRNIGGVTNGAVIADFAEMGRGIQATRDIVEEEEILFIPMRGIICKSTIMKSVSPELRVLFRDIRSETTLMAAFLMHERSSDKLSEWFPYLQLLPKSIPRPVFFSEEEIDALQDEQLIQTIKNSIHQLDSTYDLLNSRIFEHPTYNGNSAYMTKELFYWADSVISSRALTLEGKKYLVPYADMMNGKSSAQSREFSSGQHFLHYHQLKKDGMHILSDRVSLAGEQMFEDYGDNENYIYFLYHGFVMEDNPFSVVHVPFVSPHKHGAERKKRILDYLRLSSFLEPSNRMFFSINSKAQLAETHDKQRIEAYLHVLSMNITAAEHCEESLIRSSRNKGLSESVRVACFASQSPDLDSLSDATRKLDVLQTLERIVLDVNNNFPSSLEEDNIQLQNEWISEYMRIEVKKLVRNVLHNMSLRIKALRFNEWIKGLSTAFPVNKLNVELAGDSRGLMRLGTYASAPISENEVYLSVPTEHIISAETGLKCPDLGPVIRDVRGRFRASDTTQELVLHVMYEKFVKMNESFWYPYLSIIPDVHEMNMPLYYTTEEMQLLEGTDLFNTVQSYQKRVVQSYKGLEERVFRAFRKVFREDVFTFANYQWATAIVDSRSIWWDGTRHLVPLLDMINCMEGPDGTKVHKTELDVNTAKHAITRAKWPFRTGEQVFENYGQANYIYLLYHGFILDRNSHDCVYMLFDVSLKRPSEEYLNGLRRMGIRSFKPEFCIDVLHEEGIPWKFQTFMEFLFHNKQEIEQQRNQQQVQHNVHKHISWVDLALEEVEKRMKRIETNTKVSNFNEETASGRERMIYEFIQQQQQLLMELHRKLNALNTAHEKR